MDNYAKPTPEELRKAQSALDALNLAYAYFTPLPFVVKDTDEAEADYQTYGKAA